MKLFSTKLATKITTTEPFPNNRCQALGHVTRVPGCHVTQGLTYLELHCSSGRTRVGNSRWSVGQDRQKTSKTDQKCLPVSHSGPT